MGTFASRAAVMSGNAVALAARNVREKALRIAAEALEADPGDLEIVDGVVHVKGDPEASIALSHGLGAVQPAALRVRRGGKDGNAVRAATPTCPSRRSPRTRSPGWRARTTTPRPSATFANGMHAAIVETDPETAEITILRYCVVHDCGTLINPMIVEGQVHGGVAQGVGGALYERMAYDEAGQLLNASFMDFLMPYASEVPLIETDHLETPSPLNPLGIKGAGEAGCIPVTAVIASAIEDAEGFPITSMPISPTELWELRRRHADGETCAARVAAPASPPSSRRNVPMKVSGSAALNAARRPGLGRRSTTRPCSPAPCRAARRCARWVPTRYAMTVTAGVASIKGTYEGDVALTQQNPPGSFTLKASGAGAPGTVSADVAVSLVDSRRRRHRPRPTTPTPSSAASSAGSASGCSPVSPRRWPAQFFEAVDADIAGVRAPAPAAAAPAADPARPAGAGAGCPGRARGAAPAVARPRRRRPSRRRPARTSLVGALVGGGDRPGRRGRRRAIAGRR